MKAAGNGGKSILAEFSRPAKQKEKHSGKKETCIKNLYFLLIKENFAEEIKNMFTKDFKLVFFPPQKKKNSEY